MSNKLTLEKCKETFWNVRPNKRRVVEVFGTETINGRLHVILKETETGRISKPIYWGHAIDPKREGVPDTFKCHPHSLESMTETFWNVRPNKRGLVEITKKWRKNGHTWVELKEISTDETHEMQWSQAIDPSCEGVPPHFKCYDGTRNFPCNTKLCPSYLCHTKSYGNSCTTKFYTNEQGFLTFGVLGEGNTTKSRYLGNALLKQIRFKETFNCFIYEKNMISRCIELIGPPDAGKEAWYYTKEREIIMKKIFDEECFESSRDVTMNYAQTEFDCSHENLERNKVKILEAVEKLKMNNNSEIFSYGLSA